MRRLVGALLLVALAMPVGCGSGEDDESPPPAAVSSQDQVRRLVFDLQRAFLDGDGARYCAGLTGAERRDVVEFGRLVSYGSRCEQVIAAASKATRSQGIDADLSQPKKIDVRIEGNQATAIVRERGNQPRRLRVVKVNGDWKLSDSGIDADPLAAAGAGAGM